MSAAKRVRVEVGPVSGGRMELGALGLRRRRGPAMTTRQRRGKRATFHRTCTSLVMSNLMEPMEVDPPAEEPMEVDLPAA